MLIRFFLIFFAACLSAPAAAADWLRAESDHFVVHAKLEEAKLREVVQRIENFDRLLNGVLPGQIKPGRKLHLYLEPDDRRISRVSDFRNIGFSMSAPETVSAFVVYQPSEEDVFRYYALFYAQSIYHIDNAFFRPTAPWIRTGAPLFFATAYVNEEGDFILGSPDILRPMKGSVTQSKLEELIMTAALPRTETNWRRYYVLSREAVNPLLIESEYSGLLETYLDAYSSGKSMQEAAETLGDIKVLAKQIQERRTSRRPTFRRLTLPEKPPAQIAVRVMQEDEIALVEPRFLRFRSDERDKAAKALERLSGKFPDSSPVWFEFAAAEFARAQASQFGGEPVFRGFGFSNGELIVSANPYSDAKAWRAVSRALAIDPDNAQAIRLKAEILLSRLVKSGDLEDAAAYDDVRAILAPLASTPESQPLAAALYFQSYIEQGAEPPDEAVDLLGKAFVANPGVEEFRYAYAVALSRRGQRDVARSLLTSMLNHPEFSTAAERALEQTP